jgi:hypothetical protein
MKEDFCNIKKIIAMEKIILILKFVFLILCISAVSCGDTLEMAASRKTGFVNIVRKDGIEFRLSLLNEQGNPALVFREGENFSFHFEMENVRKDDRRQYVAHIMGYLFGSGFCDVYTRNGDLSIALFQHQAACGYVMRTLPFDGENRLTVSLPLYDDSEEWRNGTCVYRRNTPSVLPKGSYSTGFTCTFDYCIPPEWDGKDWNSIPPKTWVEVGPITMNIDFTVE